MKFNEIKDILDSIKTGNPIFFKSKVPAIDEHTFQPSAIVLDSQHMVIYKLPYEATVDNEAFNGKTDVSTLIRKFGVRTQPNEILIDDIDWEIMKGV